MAALLLSQYLTHRVTNFPTSHFAYWVPNPADTSYRPGMTDAWTTLIHFSSNLTGLTWLDWALAVSKSQKIERYFIHWNWPHLTEVLALTAGTSQTKSIVSGCFISCKYCAISSLFCHPVHMLQLKIHWYSGAQMSHVNFIILNNITRERFPGNWWLTKYRGLQPRFWLFPGATSIVNANNRFHELLPFYLIWLSCIWLSRVRGSHDTWINVMQSSWTAISVHNEL